MNESRVKMLGRFLKQRRLDLGWSARYLGRISGINYQTIIRIENGQFEHPGPDRIKAIAEAMDMNLTSVWDVGGYFDTRLPEPLPYLRAKFRDMPAADLDALSRDVAEVLKAHGLDDPSLPEPGEDEFDDEPPLATSSPSKGGTP